MPSFAQRIISWQRRHGRHDLPWQAEDSYHIWLSEIMLQQTQVATVIPYYLRFVSRFPDIAALAAASEEEVLAQWSGLGYYSRARNLHRAAKIILQLHAGKFPREFDAILALPGIGRSTAAAISALAFHQRRAILDGNVKRVLARYCAVTGLTSDNKIETQLWQHAEALLPRPAQARKHGKKGDSNSSISRYTQGLMDLGATICTRTKPGCDACPVRHDCKAFQTGRVALFPTPRPSKVLPEKHGTFLMLRHGNAILLEKRPSSGIWGGLWCLPQIENEKGVSAYCMQHFGAMPIQVVKLPAFTHTFTHFHLRITPLLAQIAIRPSQVQETGLLWMEVKDALHAAIPAPVRKMLEETGGE